MELNLILNFLCLQVNERNKREYPWPLPSLFQREVGLLKKHKILVLLSFSKTIETVLPFALLCYYLHVCTTAYAVDSV